MAVIAVTTLGSVAGCGASAPATASERCEDSLQAWAGAGFRGSVVVHAGGRQTCAAGLGVDADTVFSIGSVTKSVTAAAAERLVDEGRLSLRDTAGEVVRGLRGPVRTVTVDDLLRHRSGLTGAHGRDGVPLSRRQAIAAISRLELAFRPGTDELYSNAGYTLLALMIEAASGLPYDAYVSSVAPGRPWNRKLAARRLDWALAGNGDRAMTMRQLARWTAERFAGESDRGVPAGWAAVRGFGEPVVASAGGGGDTGQNAVVVRLPRRDRTIAIASSRTSTVAAERLIAAVGPALARDEAVPAPPRRRASAEELRRVAGRYGPFLVGRRGGRLQVTVREARAFRALFGRPAGAAEHEGLVRRLLAGQTKEGRRERQAITPRFGSPDELELLGTARLEGELRTYLTNGSAFLWYAVDERGGIRAVEAPTAAPSLLLDPAGDGAWSSGQDGGAIVRFRRDRIVVGSVTARR